VSQKEGRLSVQEWIQIPARVERALHPQGSFQKRRGMASTKMDLGETQSSLKSQIKKRNENATINTRNEGGKPEKAILMG